MITGWGSKRKITLEFLETLENQLSFLKYHILLWFQNTIPSCCFLFCSLYWLFLCCTVLKFWFFRVLFLALLPIFTLSVSRESPTVLWLQLLHLDWEFVNIYHYSRNGRCSHHLSSWFLLVLKFWSCSLSCQLCTSSRRATVLVSWPFPILQQYFLYTPFLPVL